MKDMLLPLSILMTDLAVLFILINQIYICLIINKLTKDKIKEKENKNGKNN